MSGLGAELCEYERQRLANIARNEAQLAQLGIFDTKRDMAQESRQKAKAARRRQISTLPAEASRASSRIAGKEAPSYRELADTEQRARSAGGPWRTRVGHSRRDFYATGFNNTVWPSQEQVKAAAAAGEATVDASALPASVKVMLPSHVSGGYWLQMPVDLTASLASTKTRMRLIDSEGVEPEAGGPGFPVIWLPRGSGGGLSGGWRGYAIERELGVGDVVAFEKLDGARLKATVHRAMTLEERLTLASSSGGGASPLGESPRNPRSAFVFFSAEQRPKLLAENRELYSQFGQMGKKLGELWRGMSEEDKAPHIAKAKEERKRMMQTAMGDGDGGDDGGAAKAAEGAQASEGGAAAAAKGESLAADEEADEGAPAQAAAEKLEPAEETPASRPKRKRAAAQEPRKRRAESPPDIAQAQAEVLYEVEKVVDKRTKAGGALEYKVQWKGFDRTHDSWEPAAGLGAATAAVTRFELRKGRRVSVKFGKTHYEGVVMVVHKATAGQQSPDFSVTFDADGETWRISHKDHVFKLV